MYHVACRGHQLPITHCERGEKATTLFFSCVYGSHICLKLIIDA